MHLRVLTRQPTLTVRGFHCYSAAGNQQLQLQPPQRQLIREASSTGRAASPGAQTSSAAATASDTQALRRRVANALTHKALPAEVAFAKEVPVHPRASWQAAWTARRTDLPTSQVLQATQKVAQEMSLQLEEVASSAQRTRALHVVEAPSSYGQPQGGVQRGPLMMSSDLVRDRAGLLTTSPPVSISCARAPSFEADGGDITRVPAELRQSTKAPSGGVSLKNSQLVGDMNAAIHAQVGLALARQDSPFVFNFGGDHSIAVGSCIAARDFCRSRGRKLGILWVDAHADINCPTTSPSGNIHGMPLAWYCNLEHLSTGKHMSQYPGWSWLEGKVPVAREEVLGLLDDTVYIGLRDVDEEEQRLIDGQHASLGINQIKQFDCADIERLGIEHVMDQAIAHFDARGVTDIWMSYDIDVINPAWVPCTGTDVDGGLSLDGTFHVALAMAADGRLLGMDTVELNPEVEGKQHGEQLTRRVCELLNFAALGHAPDQTALLEVLELAHVYDQERVATVKAEYASSHIELPSRHARITAVALAQHLEAEQIRREFESRGEEQRSPTLDEAGHLRTAWRTLRTLQMASFVALLEEIFAAADVNDDESVSHEERVSMLARLATAEGTPAWWPSNDVSAASGGTAVGRQEWPTWCVRRRGCVVPSFVLFCVGSLPCLVWNTYRAGPKRTGESSKARTAGTGSPRALSPLSGVGARPLVPGGQI